MRIVLDASLALGCLFVDEVTQDRLEVLQRVSGDGGLVPSIWHLEVANALNICVKRGRCDEAFVDRSLRRLTQLPIVVDQETGTHAWTHILALARAERLTVYDAAYLELAIRRKLPLASCDGALVLAARRSGLAVMTGGE